MSIEPPVDRRRFAGRNPLAVAVKLAAWKRADKKAAAALAAAGAAPAAYPLLVKLLHWIMALLVLAVVPLGFAMKRLSLPLETTFTMQHLHRSLGVAVVACVAMSLLIRLRRRAPSWPEGSGLLARLAMLLTSIALYALMIAAAVSGWLMISAAVSPVPTRIFNWFPLPHWPGLADLPVEARKGWFDVYRAWHLRLGVALAGVAILHTVLAFRIGRGKGGFIGRMVPGSGA